MANFTPSNLVKGQAIFNDQFMSGEWRAPDSAAITTANTGAKANPSLAGLRSREDRAVDAYFPIRQASTNGTGRAHNHTGNRGDSLDEEITWSTFAESFSISKKMADNNVYDFSQMFAATQKNSLFNLINRVDSWFVSNLISNKTQVNAGGGRGVFDGTADDYQVAAAEQDLFYENVKAMMEQNLYRGNITGIIDSRANVLARNVGNQGTGNQSNLGYQLQGFDQLATTTRSILDVPATYTESGIFFETGLVGVVPRIPVQNRKALDPERAMSYNGDSGSISIPELGMDIAVHAYTERADTSSSNGDTQDEVMQYELSVDVGFVPAPLSNTNETVIFSAGVLAP